MATRSSASAASVMTPESRGEREAKPNICSYLPPRARARAPGRKHSASPLTVPAHLPGSNTRPGHPRPPSGSDARPGRSPPSHGRQARPHCRPRTRTASTRGSAVRHQARLQRPPTRLSRTRTAPAQDRAAPPPSPGHHARHPGRSPNRTASMQARGPPRRQARPRCLPRRPRTAPAPTQDLAVRHQTTAATPALTVVPAPHRLRRQTRRPATKPALTVVPAPARLRRKTRQPRANLLTALLGPARPRRIPLTQAPRTKPPRGWVAWLEGHHPVSGLVVDRHPGQPRNPSPARTRAWATNHSTPRSPAKTTARASGRGP